MYNKFYKCIDHIATKTTRLEFYLEVKPTVQLEALPKKLQNAQLVDEFAVDLTAEKLTRLVQCF